MNLPALLERLHVLSLSSTVPSSLDVDLRHAVAVGARSITSAASAREARSQRIDAAIRAEGERLPVTMALHRRVRIVKSGIKNRIEVHELTRVPGDKRIRKGLRRMDNKSGRSEQSAS